MWVYFEARRARIRRDVGLSYKPYTSENAPPIRPIARAAGFGPDIYGLFQTRIALSVPDMMRAPKKVRIHLSKSYRLHSSAGTSESQKALCFTGARGARIRRRPGEGPRNNGAVPDVIRYAR